MANKGMYGLITTKCVVDIWSKTRTIIILWTLYEQIICYKFANCMKTKLVIYSEPVRKHILIRWWLKKKREFKTKVHFYT